MPYLYEGHMGSIYCTDYEQDYDSLYCETCGDSDVFVGFYESLNEMLFDYGKNGRIDIGDGGWDLNYFLSGVSRYFKDNVTYKEAIEIIKRAKDGHSSIR